MQACGLGAHLQDFIGFKITQDKSALLHITSASVISDSHGSKLC